MLAYEVGSQGFQGDGEIVHLSVTFVERAGLITPEAIHKALALY